MIIGTTKKHMYNRISVIIPARGGSKGVPRKNVLPLCGKPLIAWNIEAAIKTKAVDSVYVTTDDEEISSIAKQYGAKVIMRPKQLANDEASSESAILHALDVIESTNKLPDLLVFMQCTSPLTLSEDIDQAINTLVNEAADSCLTVGEFHCFVWKVQENGSAIGVNHDKSLRPRRQDRESQYIENGAVYVMNVDGFRQAKHRFFGKSVLSIMPIERCVEIDDPVDLKVVEVLMQNQITRMMEQNLPKKISAVAFDFDGVMTDNRVWVDQNGVETVACDRSDGWGISQLKKVGIRLIVLSTEANRVVSMRCDKLGIECIQGLGAKKIEAFYNWCEKYNLNTNEVVYVGNDDNDIDTLMASGCAVVPADASPRAKAVAQILLQSKGGFGAVRELCEMINAKTIKI